tara:strand:+ start:2344 stop:3666 length:1323 start_codon:yes stop_codon:yes gene_type:complete
MAVSIAQYVDLLFKKLQGVAKTANSISKGASNESIASPAFIRGDVVWMEADQITAIAGAISSIANARINGTSVECVADITVSPVGGIRPTWLSNVQYWIPQEFGPTWLPKVFVAPAGEANVQATGTQIFSAGIGGVGEYFFDTQAGVLNFIGETIPSVLTAGNVVYISGYEYVGSIGVNNNTGNVNIGNLTIANTTISTSLADGNITLDATGNAIVQITGTAGVSIPTGDTGERPNPAIAGTLRLNTDTNVVEIYTGTVWKSAGDGLSVISNQTIEGDGVTDTFTLNQDATAAGILVTVNGVSQTPGVDYDVSSGDQLTFTTTPIVSDTVQVRFITVTTTISALTNTVGNTTVATTASGNINFEINSSTVAQITNASILDISAAHSLQLPTYTVSQASGLNNVATGQVIYVSDGASGSPCLAVYSGGGWKQIAVGSAITT